MRRYSRVVFTQVQGPGRVLAFWASLASAVIISLLAACWFVPGANATEAGGEAAARKVEAENMRIIARPGKRLGADRYASGGEYVLFRRNSSLSRSVTTSQPTDEIVVRGAGRYCKGWTKAQVRVDGTSVGTIALRNKRWKTFVIAPERQIAPGSHTVKISFINNKATSNCDRDLYLDKVTLRVKPAEPDPSGLTCDKYAATTGSDTSGTGASGQPYATPEKLVASLAAGQTGCLKAGSYGAGETWQITNSGKAGARVTLMSDPNGGKATLYKRVVIPQGTSFVTLSNLKIDGSKNATYTYGVYASPTVYGDDVQLIANDITNRSKGICVFVGDPTYGTAERTLIKDNVVHHCGVPGNLHMHGIYNNYAHSSLIVGNVIHNIAAKGVVLYRDADDAVVRGNIIDRVGTGVLFGGDNNRTTDRAVVRNNVITNATRNNEGIAEWWAQSPSVGKGNIARHNCLWSSGSVKHAGVSGYSSDSNTYAAPQYADAAAGNYKVGNETCAALLEEGKD